MLPPGETQGKTERLRNTQKEMVYKPKMLNVVVLLMEENPAPVDSLISVCSIIYKVIYIPGGAGFLPPTAFASTCIKKITKM